MLILALDCSLSSLSVCLMEDDVVLADYNNQMSRGQAEILMPVIDDLFKKAQRDIKSLDVVGVGVGPGSFTGVRVAISAGRAIAMALDIPVYGVTTFESASYGYDKPITVAIDTKRDDYYVQEFKKSLCPISTPDIQTKVDLVNKNVMIDVPNDELSSLNFPHSLAENISRIVYDRGDKNNPALPLYLRDANVTL